MGHRAKHLRRNWIPERLAAASARATAEKQRQAEAAARREAAELQAEYDSGRTELELGS